MFQFQAQITDNGNKSRLFTYESIDNSFSRAAWRIMEDAHVQNGGHVVVALMTFDHPSHSFQIQSYEYDVISGRIENLKAVK